MKIMHCSDIHLGRRPAGGTGDFSNNRYDDYFKAFKSCIDKAVIENAEVIIIAGDLFDKKIITPETLKRTEAILMDAVEKEIKIIVTEGNHDNITNGKESESWIDYLCKNGYMTRLSSRYNEDGYDFDKIEINDIHFYGAGYPGALADEVISELAGRLNENEKNIVVVHTGISNSEIIPGTVTPQTIDKFKDKVIYMAGGHLHSHSAYPKEEPYFFIPGSLEYWDLGEKEDLKGYIIFDTETKEYSFHESEKREKISYSLKTSVETNDKLLEFIGKECFEDSFEDKIVQLKIKLENSFFADIAGIENLFYEKGALKVLVKIIYPGVSREDIDNKHISIDDVEKKLIKKWEFFSEHTEITSKTLQKLKSLHLENDDEHFFEVFDNMLDNLKE